jgi:hypothetical protein
VVVGSGGIKKFLGISAGTDPGIESKTWGTLKSSGSESMMNTRNHEINKRSVTRKKAGQGCVGRLSQIF